MAILAGNRVLSLARRREPSAVAALLLDWRPRLVAVDSPAAPAPDGELSRACERALARAVCGIRYTPERARLAGNPYYEWVVHGFGLYRALAGAGLEAIECFPTAAWTRWAGARGRVPRSAWSRDALARFGLEGVPGRLGQDYRDAVGAALTARAHGEGRTERFGEIVVPLRA